MEWYQVKEFKDRVASIEQFLVEIAANRRKFEIHGFSYALSLPAAGEAVEALLTFSEDFSSLNRQMLRIDRALGQELAQLDSAGKITEQVSLVALKVRMASAAFPAGGLVQSLSAFLPRIFKLFPTNNLFGDEQVSLETTIINLGRLRGVIGVCNEFLRSRAVSDDEVFKPSNLSSEKVADYLARVSDEIDQIESLTPSERTRLQGYIFEARREAASTNPSWPKVVGALVIIAAVTSGIADAYTAASNVKSAIKYILDNSLDKQRNNRLPGPASTAAPASGESGPDSDVQLIGEVTALF